MSTPQKTIIIVHWLGTDKIEAYTSLKCFVEHNKKYNLSTLNNYISRKKAPYINTEVSVMRVDLVERLHRYVTSESGLRIKVK